MNLRRYARDKECQIRIPGVCNFDAATTGLAHLRMAGITGRGQKSPDILASWACSACAAQTENGYCRNDKDKIAFLEGMVRTQYCLIREEKIRW